MFLLEDKLRIDVLVLQFKRIRKINVKSVFKVIFIQWKASSLEYLSSVRKVRLIEENDDFLVHVIYE